jgi:F0F1-type ATP synthase membrane subunit b/b'
MTDLDILSIDAKIRKNFEEETSKLFEHKEKLQEIEETLKNENLRRRIRNSLEKARDDLKIYVHDLSTQKQLHFYIMETLSFIEQYKEILKIPVKVSFIGKLIKNDKEKYEIIEIYI